MQIQNKTSKTKQKTQSLFKNKISLKKEKGYKNKN